jgi:valyl-tRNA synthetase
MSAPLAPQYDPSHIEPVLYRWWMEQRLFEATGRGRSRFVVMMPPPNVTANLHMGHGLNNTIQDVLVRFERMRGRDTLWLPGTDHAGIATQNVVEKILAREGKTRFDLGRPAFEQMVWEYVEKTGAVILDQLKAIGSSCDWSRTYFTLDEDLSRAVREVFVRLYESGLIYRGHYLINWCPRCLTALSNEEAEKEEVDGHLWYLKYPLGNGRFITVATTRPETMLGDTAVAVHPQDERYAALVGSMVELPLTGRKIPIIADAGIDPAFGTGAVKVTPAHDALDFDIGKRHQLESLDILTPEAKISAAAPEAFRGLDRFEARKRVVQAFKELGLLEKVENHRHAVAHCYRCETVIEPRLSDQWFVKMAPLAQKALAAYRKHKVRFIPERRGDEYVQWMENIRDWCISRQLWWGHRIPVWYCLRESCARVAASLTDLRACPGCGGPVRQDEDVLDTWFSSQLVPFSSLGWPDDTADLRAFYPGHTLITAPEILFFWVARMIMSGLEFMGEVPFNTVYLHGTVRDTQHRKMSKSLGNGIDPLEVIDRYGADALRYTVVAGMAVGTDLILDPADLDTSFAAGRNFANKLWNAGRFILGNLDGPTRPLAGAYTDTVAKNDLTLADRWIIARCDATVRAATEAYERYRFNEAASAIYHFIWSDLADWYIEQIKPRLYGDVPGGEIARAVAAATFETALRLLHPIMPFITEALWQRLPGKGDGASISTAPWPGADARARDDEALAHFAAVQEMVSAIRNLRASYGVNPGQQVNAYALPKNSPYTMTYGREWPTIKKLAKVSNPTMLQGGGMTPEAATSVLSDGTEVFIALEGPDLEREKVRLGEEHTRLKQLINAQHSKLSNAAFVAKAPPAVVEKERQKLLDWSAQAEVISNHLARLGVATGSDA